MLELRVAIAKTKKYASGESGDSVEIVERARGGLSVILSDGQGSGKSARITSSMVVNKAVSLLADGARDGAVARAVHDFLYAHKNGRVSATLTIVSVDLHSKTLLISRNSHTPVIVVGPRETKIFDRLVSPIGVHNMMKPEISELPLEPGTIIVTFSDGALDAGKRYGTNMTIEDFVDQVTGYRPEEVQDLVDNFLRKTCSLDQNRPADDTAIVALALGENKEDLKVSKMSVVFPI